MKKYRNDEGDLHCKGSQVIEFRNGTKMWYLNGQRHRTDGPAVEWFDGGKEWWIDGQRHRRNSPAVERADGTKEWWIDGEHIYTHLPKTHFKPKTYQEALDNIKNRVDKMKNARGHCEENSHIEEDIIHTDVLRYIADNDTGEMGELARIALETEDVDFTRYYS